MVPEKEPSGVLASLEKTWGWCAPEEAMIRQEVYNGAFRGKAWREGCASGETVRPKEA